MFCFEFFIFSIFPATWAYHVYVKLKKQSKSFKVRHKVTVNFCTRSGNFTVLWIKPRFNYCGSDFEGTPYMVFIGLINRKSIETCLKRADTDKKKMYRLFLCKVNRIWRNMAGLRDVKVVVGLN